MKNTAGTCPLSSFIDEKFAGDFGADGRQIHLEPALKSLSVCLRWCDPEASPNKIGCHIKLRQI